MPTDAEIAWLAGIFEGEGCFGMRRQVSRPDAARSVRMEIAMSDFDVLARISAIFGGDVRIKQRLANNKDHYKPMWYWRVGSSEEVARLIRLMWPWLGSRRRARAQELLDAIEARPEAGSTRATHCKQGHALTPENLVVRGGTKYMRCRQCAVVSWTKSNKKRSKAVELSRAS